MNNTGSSRWAARLSGSAAAAGALALALPVLALPALAGCAQSDSILVVTGRVDDELVKVALPRIPAPTLDITTGISAGRGPSPGGWSGSPASSLGGGSSWSGSPASGPGGRTGWSSSSAAATTATTATFTRIADVPVTEGGRVTTGQLVTRLDDGAVTAAVSAAGAAVATARAKVDVLDDAIAKTQDTEADLLEKRRTVTATIRALTSKRLELQAGRNKAGLALAKVGAGLRRLGTGLARLDATIAGLSAKLAELPSDRPELEPVRRQFLAQRSALVVQRQSLSGKRTQALQAREKLRHAIAAMTTGLRRIGSGLGKAEQGLARLDTGLSRVREARRTLRHNRTLARSGIDAATVRQRSARLAAAQARVTSPVDGVIINAPRPGEVLATGATLVTIRADVAPTITTWVPPARLGDVCQGGSVSLRGDWMAGEAAAQGVVTSIGDSTEYPPSRMSSDEVHLTRAVPVRVTAAPTPGSPALPPGALVDVRFGGCPTPRSSSPPSAPRENP